MLNSSSQILPSVYFHSVFVFVRKMFYIVLFKNMSQASPLKTVKPTFLINTGKKV